MEAWKKLRRADARISAWSGGETAQLLIEPPEADYAARDFLWRVSSATVELERSDFTPLPDYRRYIATLEGEIRLRHNGGAPICLKPLEVHAFDGADDTRSEGRCTDFNLMLRKGAAEGSMRTLRVCGAADLQTEPGAQTLLLFCAQGSCTVTDGARRESLSPGESLLLAANAKLCLRLEGEAELLCCQMGKTRA
ncbi:MAG: HutD family protein [Oscillospiraceae bacterium]|nr:HutD family protein [Oscillospiraceae bacterium]